MQNQATLFVLSLSATLLMLGVGMIVALLPQRVHAMTGSLESVGFVASVFAFAYLLAQLPIGALSDRFGPKRFLVMGYLLCALSGVVFFLAGSPGGIYFGRAIQGIGEAPVWALGPAILSLAYADAKGRTIGIYNAAIHAGLTAGPLLGLLVAPDSQGSLPFLAFAVLCLFSGLCVLFFLGPIPGSLVHGSPSIDQFLDLLRQQMALLVLVGVLLYGAGYGAFLTVLPVSLAASHGFDPKAISLLYVFFYGAISLAQFFAGSLSDRFGRQGFLVWGMLLAAVGLVTYSFFPGHWVYIPLGLASIGLGIFCVASIAELNELAPDNLKGASSGSYYFFWGVGYVLGPLAIGMSSPLIGFVFLAVLFGLHGLAVRFTWSIR